MIRIAPADILDNLIDMNTADPDHTVIDSSHTAILDAGTQGTPQGTWSVVGAGVFTVEKSNGPTRDRRCQCFLRDIGTNYLPSSPHRVLRYDNTGTLTYCVITTTGGKFFAMTVDGYITLGMADAGSSGKPFDLFSIFNVNGNFTVFQVWNGASPVNNAFSVNLHTNPAGVSTVTGDFVVAQGSTHRVSLQMDSANATAELYLYDLNGVLETHITAATNTGFGAISTVRIGNNEIGTSPGTNTDFEGIGIDWVKALSPLGVGSTTFWRDKNASATNGGSSLTTVSSNFCAVYSGDLVVVGVKYEGTVSNPLPTCVDSNGSPLVLLPGSLNGGGTNGAPHTSMFYYVAASNGLLSFTVTFSAAKTFADICVLAETPPDGASTPVLDGTPTGATGSSGSAASGNITTTGSTGMVFAFYGEFGALLGPVAIAVGTNAQNRPDGYQVASAAANSLLFCVRYSAPFTGQATGTLSASNQWALQIAAFNAPMVVDQVSGRKLSRAQRIEGSYT